MAGQVVLISELLALGGVGVVPGDAHLSLVVGEDLVDVFQDRLYGRVVEVHQVDVDSR